MYQGLKMRSKVGISPKSLCYGFLNEIMVHPWLDWGLRITRLGCTKFNERCTKFNVGCTKFCEGYTKFCKECTKGANVRSKVRNNFQSLPEGP